VDSLIQIGHFSEAERLAHSLPYQNDWATEQRFEDLAIALAKIGSFDEAERIIRSSAISESGVVLAQLAQILAQAEHHSQSEKIFAEAEKLILSTKDVRYMVALALALAQAGYRYTSQVNKIIDEAEQVLKSTSYEFPFSLQYEELALVLIKSGSFSEAERVALLFGTAAPTADFLKLVRVSVNLIEIGQIKRAFAVLVGLQSLDDYWDVITSWTSALKKNESDLPAIVLRDAAFIIGWEKPEFQKIYALLSSESDSYWLPV